MQKAPADAIFKPAEYSMLRLCLEGLCLPTRYLCAKGKNHIIRRLLAASAGLALLHAQALAGTQHIGVITMFLCDDGLDLCSNTLSSSPVFLSTGAFTEDFVFDFVNNFIDVPDNVPLLKGTALLETSNPADLVQQALCCTISWSPVRFQYSVCTKREQLSGSGFGPNPPWDWLLRRSQRSFEREWPPVGGLG